MPGNHFHLRQEIVRVGQLMYEKGFIAASDGNISARLGSDRFLITPSGLHKGFLESEQLLVVDGKGQKAGPSTAANRRLKPTSELPMHLEAYSQRPDIGAVVHAHPPITVALSLASVPLADCLLPEVIVFLGLIPTSEYATPSSEENVRAIRDLIKNHDAMVLQRHGSLTVGDSPMQAFMRLETVEQNARIAFMLAQLGIHNPLPAEEVEKLLAMRQEMGLSHAGEVTEFCEVCGVCHTGSNHARTLRPGAFRHPVEQDRQSETGVKPFAAGPQTLPPIGRPSLPAEPFGQPALETAEIRRLVAQIVHKTLGTS